MKLRWLVIQNREPTSQEVFALRDETGNGPMQCKKELTNKVGPVLQYWDESMRVGDWLDVPTVTMIRENNEN